MVCCAIRSCTSRSNVLQKKSSGITYHRFPKDPVLRNAWIKFVNRGAWKPTKYSVLCSKHFAECYFDRTSHYTVRLRDNAVPLLNTTQIPTEREQWAINLKTNLSEKQYVCDLHFQSDDVQHSYVTTLPNGEVNIMAKGRRTRKLEAAPLILNKQQQKQRQQEHQLQQVQQLQQEQHLQHNEIIVETQHPVSNKGKVLSACDEVSTKLQKCGEHDIDNSDEISLDDDIVINNIITELNKSFPIGWCFFPGDRKLTAIQLDRQQFKERIRLVIDADRSVMVTYVEGCQIQVDIQIQSVNDLIDFLKLVEKKLCADTGFDKKSESPQIRNQCHTEDIFMAEKLLSVENSSSLYCRLCLSVCRSDCYIELFSAANENATRQERIRHMLQDIIPDLDLTLTFNPGICTKCEAKLYAASDFISHCSQNQETLFDYKSKYVEGPFVNIKTVVEAAVPKEKRQKISPICENHIETIYIVNNAALETDDNNFNSTDANLEVKEEIKEEKDSSYFEDSEPDFSRHDPVQNFSPCSSRNCSP